jgi:hypothetical protein
MVVANSLRMSLSDRCVVGVRACAVSDWRRVTRWASTVVQTVDEVELCWSFIAQLARWSAIVLPALSEWERVRCWKRLYAWAVVS